MIKRRVQSLLQRLLGLRAYLFLFGLYAMAKFRWAEPAFFRFLGLIPAEGVLLDIGANLGVTTTLLSRRFPKAKIIAFEPVPWNAANIERMANLFRLRNVSIQKCAIGSQDGFVDFTVPIVSGARMHALGHLSSASEEGEQLRVRCCKLDDLGLSGITAVKLDVENSEHAALIGGLATLRRWQPVIYCELWNNENRQRSFELLGSLGYVPYTTCSTGLVPFDDARGQTENFIFLPRR